MKKTNILNNVLPLVAVALVGVLFATSCEKEKNTTESPQTPTINERSEVWECIDSLYSIRITMYPDALKFYTEVEDNRSEMVRRGQPLKFYNAIWSEFYRDTVRHSAYGYPAIEPLMVVTKTYNSSDTSFYPDGGVLEYQVLKETNDSIYLEYVGMRMDFEVCFYNFKKIYE